MTPPFTLPDWAPPWVGFVILVVAGLFCLAFLLMPFSVFGLKGRLDAVDARLDEIQGEIRNLVLRLPERARTDYEIEAEQPRRWAEPQPRPPIPPRSPSPDRPAPPPTRRVEPIRTVRSDPARTPRVDALRTPRAEPRFDPS